MDIREEYIVDIGGAMHTLLLTPEDAQRYGDSAVKAGEAPANKAGEEPANK